MRGYRVFTETEIANLQFIAKAPNLGFSRAEIRDLLSLRNENCRACPEVRGLIHRKLQNVREKIASLKQLESELTRGLRSCDRALKTQH
jgi:DNA-binding transcriptional MerR regulator